MKYTTYVGSYTSDEHPEGIHVLESDAETGAFRVVNVIDTVPQPIYMALNRDGTMLYSVTGRSAFGPNGRNGGLAAFRLNATGEKLELVNEIATGWTVPCYVALDPSEKALVYAEYSCGTAGYADLRADGSIDPTFAGAPNEVKSLCQVKHVGDGPNKPRQDSAHAHCSIVTPDGKFQMVVDLTLDKIVAYDFANRAQGLKVVPSATIDTGKVAPGAGPRHIVFHPNGKLAFVIFELNSLVASYRYTGEGFEFIQIENLLAKGFTDFSKAAAIKLSADGSQVFCSNRGHDSITVFNVDEATGKMEFLNNAKLHGQFPRDFEFFPGGKFCMVGLKESWRLASYAYDAAKGSFDLVSSQEGIFRPLYFKFKTT